MHSSGAKLQFEKRWLALGRIFSNQSENCSVVNMTKWSPKAHGCTFVIRYGYHFMIFELFFEIKTE